MLVIGITGGIGSGKSLVVKLLTEHFAVAAIDTDTLAKELMKKGRASYNRVVEHFGTELLQADGEIDRERLSKLVFADQAKLALLNSLTHPAVHEEVLSLIRKYRESGRYQAVLVETALLIEAGYQSFCDEIWYVHAKEEVRRARLKESRGYSDEKIDSIFAKQKSEEEFYRYATWIIENNAGEEEVLRELKQVMSAKCP
ncbi:MAG: dephospho-CoA kinase [Lachnospiraceae bacterium]|nr:dephospho-CoA kinase [Lachnospiraceae bacterium]